MCSAEWVSKFLLRETTLPEHKDLPGCHVLALDLVRSWSFARPSTAIRNTPASSDQVTTASPKPSRPVFPLEPALRRHSSIMIDMDIASLPATRRASPDGIVQNGKEHPIETIQEESDLLARKAGLGSLMKFAKQDVKVPDFNMDAFF